MSEENYLPSWIPAYWLRKYFTRKIRATEDKVRLLKTEGKWAEATQLEFKLRNSWWGYKRYSK